MQIWSGYLARTAPGWALLSRGPANIPRTQGYEHFEGIIESETWFGPLFTNIRLTRTNSPVEFHVRYPLFQVQPLLRECYSGVAFEVVSLNEMSAADWQNFEATDEAQYRSDADAGTLRGRYTSTKQEEAVRSSPAVSGSPLNDSGPRANKRSFTEPS